MSEQDTTRAHGTIDAFTSERIITILKMNQVHGLRALNSFVF